MFLHLKSCLIIDSAALNYISDQDCTLPRYKRWRREIESMRLKARRLAQHGGFPGRSEESDPAGVILYVMDGPSHLAFPYHTGYPDRS